MAIDRTEFKHDVKQCGTCLRRIFPVARNGVWGYPDSCTWCGADPIQLIELGSKLSMSLPSMVPREIPPPTLTSQDKRFLTSMRIVGW